MPAYPAAPNHYDLIIIGAGIAGLNALHAASIYLPADARILLVDEKDEPGGMWTTAYDYVRLHQPHPFFTVGGYEWNWDKSPSYLARRDEVQKHLAHCLDRLRKDLTLEVKLGHVAQNLREDPSETGWQASLVLHPKDAPEQRRSVSAKQVINASGYNYARPDPIKFSSAKVVSIIPDDLRATLAQKPDAPVYVVGGGKTGMDTILAVNAENPKRPVTLINGSGTYFLSRDKAFPEGLRRWFAGTPSARLSHDCAMRFDGENEEDVRRHFIENYATNRDPRNRNFVWGLMSAAKNKRVEAALQTKVWDHLEDVIDTDAGPAMRLRGGEELALPEGSILVNCTGSFLRKNLSADWAPCLSPNDVILTISTRNAVSVLTSNSAFFLSHLFFTETLRSSGLFLLDLEALMRANKAAFAAASITQSYHNLVVGVRSLPRASREHFGLDINRWHPKMRRLLALGPLRKTAREDVKHCQMVLEKVVERFGIQGGQLTEE